ncbi:PREDICTED: transcription factor bHLH93-like [Ipomoea nil]|uniref:transcription factor bHLH93-like n=1 Tax=Ipomoea nil TaxID=35883 RepID=UPI0009018639|nr:PREDICTED: transcription factor bHLH93-like [Ipomoea nil]
MDYYSGNGFLEELLALRNESWEGNSIAMGMGMEMMNDELFCNYNGWPSSDYCTALHSFGESAAMPVPPPCTTASGGAAFCFDEFLSSLPFDQSQSYLHPEFYIPPVPFGDELSLPQLAESSSTKLESLPFPGSQEDLSAILEPVQSSSVETPSAFNIGFCGPEKKANKSKKLHGQPSKNLMAERRRRKRLNDRLSMLRSVVPKISKMDRTSILGDTIDYMKELLERINNLQEEMELGTNDLSLMSIFKNEKPNEMVVRNSPKFDVESRGEMDTRIEICCGAKPGLLLSTVATLENLGLEIQQCVISCFNDFAMQASCTKELEQREVLSSEDIRQALYRNAGYGGKCF